MARHLVLDIGNVICAWRPERVVADCVPDAGRRDDVMAATIGHPDWLALDRGTLEVDDAIARALARVDVEAAWVEAIYRRTPPSLVPIDDTVTAMHEVHEAGRAIYVLSNMARHAADYLLEHRDCFRLCTGIVMSCDTGHIKPEPGIYRYLCDTHDLQPADCFFVDDMAKNIEGARAVGLDGAVLDRRENGGRLIRDWLLRTG